MISQNQVLEMKNLRTLANLRTKARSNFKLEVLGALEYIYIYIYIFFFNPGNLKFENPLKPLKLKI